MAPAHPKSEELLWQGESLFGHETHEVITVKRDDIPAFVKMLKGLTKRENPRSVFQLSIFGDPTAWFKKIENAKRVSGVRVDGGRHWCAYTPDPMAIGIEYF